MTKLFDSNDNYTEAGFEFGIMIRPMVGARVDWLLKQGYNLRTVLGPASSPSADGLELADSYGLCPKEFHALWIGEVFDCTLSRLVYNQLKG